MNETKDLIIGIDFGKEYSQICYYDRKADEPRSLPVKVGSSQFEMPTSLCRRLEQRDYCVGLEAEYLDVYKRQGLIEDSLVFVVQEKLSNYSGKMRPGTYLLSTAYTPTRIMGILAGDAEQEGVTS